MVEWNYTRVKKDILNLEGELDFEEGRSYFKGRPIIQRDSPIDGGVFPSAREDTEAIVVDSQEYPKLKKLYKIAKNKAAKIAKRKIAKGVEWNEETTVLRAVYDTVAEAMPYQSDTLTNWLINKYKAEGDVKIALDVFLKEGIGVCRHDALACGALLELFIKEGIIKGKPSMDSNYLNDKEGHAWCRYTNKNHEVYILDVRNNYIGKLSNAPKNWQYKRPEDLLEEKLFG